MKKTAFPILFSVFGLYLLSFLFYRSLIHTRFTHSLDPSIKIHKPLYIFYTPCFELDARITGQFYFSPSEATKAKYPNLK